MLAFADSRQEAAFFAWYADDMERHRQDLFDRRKKAAARNPRPGIRPDFPVFLPGHQGVAPDRLYADKGDALPLAAAWRSAF